MKLWRIWQTENDTYETYDSAVVAAETESEAARTHPGGRAYNAKSRYWNAAYPCDDWAFSVESVSVQLIGEASEGVEAGVICASFNAR